MSRALSPEEAELWARVTATIRPLSRELLKAAAAEQAEAARLSQPRRRARPKVPPSAQAYSSRRLRGRERRSMGRGTASCAPARSSRTASSTCTASIWIARGARSTSRWNAPKCRRPGHFVNNWAPSAGRAADPARAHPRRRSRLAGGVAPCRTNCRGSGRSSAPRRRRQPLYRSFVAGNHSAARFFNPARLALANRQHCRRAGRKSFR